MIRRERRKGQKSGNSHFTTEPHTNEKLNKNLAIANRSHVRKLRTQYAESIYRHKYYTMTLKSRLRVTQGHWKRNH